MPLQDLVIPAFKRPTHYHASPYMGAPPANRTTLAYFKGDMRLAPGQDPDCKYSRWGGGGGPCGLRAGAQAEGLIAV